MQIRKAILRFIGVIVLTVFSWILVLTSQAILESNTNENLHHVPEEASFAMRLDGREIAEKTLFSVFLESKDGDVLELIQEALRKDLKSDSRFKNYGVDYLSDIIFFQIPVEGTNVEGLLVNVSNERLFSKNLKDSENIFAVNDKVGVILTLPSNSKIDKEELQQIAERIVDTEHDHKMAKFFANHDSGKFIETYNKGSFFGKTSLFGQTNVLFELQDNDLLLGGNLDFKEGQGKKAGELKKILQPKGLHFSSSIVPTALSDTLNGWLKQFGIAMPELTSISMNYHGANIVNHSSGYFVVPQMELLVECKDGIAIEDILKNEEFRNYFDYTHTAGEISIQNEKLYFKQISPTSFYIGIEPKPVFVNGKKKEIMLLSGEIAPIMNIHGGGMMMSFLTIVPEFRAAKLLADHTEQISVRLVKINDRKAYLKGELTFKEGYYPMNELMKIVLITQAE